MTRTELNVLCPLLNSQSIFVLVGIIFISLKRVLKIRDIELVVEDIQPRIKLQNSGYLAEK